MTMTFLVVSAVVAMAPVPVPGTGIYSGDAERNARTIAEKCKNIRQPIVVSDKNRQALLMIRKWAGEEALRRFRASVVNSTSPMCFDDRYEPYQFD